MAPAAAHTKWWQTGDVIFGTPLLAAIILQWLVPIPLTLGTLGPLITAGGVAFGIAGVALIALARREFARYRQPTDPGRPTGSIVSTGIFAYSRNPIYLGAACVVLGIALAARLTWMGLFLLPTLVACHYVLIAPEERYLTVRFGEEYRAYAATVYRWIGRTRRPGQ